MSFKQIKSLATTMMSNLDKDLTDKSFFKQLQQKIGVKPSYACLAIVVLICVLAIFDIAADLLTTLFGMVYPAYMSWKAVQKKDDEKKKVWLTYWIVFGMLTSVDDVLGGILNLIPGFYALRFIVYIWMFYPRPNNGAQIIYQHLKPLLLKWQAKLQGTSEVQKQPVEKQEVKKEEPKQQLNKKQE